MFPCPTDVIRKIENVPYLKSRGTYLVRKKTEQYNQKEEKRVAALLMLLAG